MLATQMPDTPPEAKDVKQVKPRAVPYVQRSWNLADLASAWSLSLLLLPLYPW